MAGAMLLAGDVGGTKTLLGLFEAHAGRPRPLAVRTYSTNAFRSFTGIVDAFAHDIGRPLSLRAAAVGVAGPVVARRATLTNVHWEVSADEIGRRLGTPHVSLLNDLEAIATSLDVLAHDEIAMLQEGAARPDGNAVVIAAGTGLGQAYLRRVDGRLRPTPSEGGHADFAARTDREMELVRELRDRFGRVEVEQVISGQGLRNLHRFTHRGGECPVVEEIEADEAPARMTQGGMSGRCQFCADGLRMFVEAYGAEAGNLALRGLATSGVYIGGGIAPKILRALQDGRFMRAFLAKAPMTDLLAQMPVGVILSPEAALIGAAVRARDLAGR
jgi:glucokinase